jgi:hypothetical protein
MPDVAIADHDRVQIIADGLDAGSIAILATDCHL